MQMIVEFFSRICARTVRMPGKIDSPGLNFTICQFDHSVERHHLIKAFNSSHGKEP